MEGVNDVQSVEFDPALPILDWFRFRDDSVVGIQAFPGPIIAYEVHGA